MKWFVIFTAFTVVSAYVPKDSREIYECASTNLYIPEDEDENIPFVDSQESVDEFFLEEYTRNLTNNEYWLFTRTNPCLAQVLKPNDDDSIKASVNFTKEIAVVVHGWKGNGRNAMNKMLTAAFLNNSDINVIVLDWSRLARKTYVTAKKGTPVVGKALGEFIEKLISLGASYYRMHLVGFSLGAHLVGCAGRQTGGKVNRITGLDPAGPLWKRDEDRIKSSDARYVEIIHTNTASLGLDLVCGDADFFPNGGNSMPGCFLISCSHSRAYEYMASSLIYNHFFANECSSMDDVVHNNCTGSLNFMGNNDLTKTRSGIFRVNTGKNYPFFE